MLDELNRFMNMLVHTQKQFLDLFEGVIGHGPKAIVQEQNNTVKIIVDAPGLSRKSLKDWNIRVMNQTALLKGRFEPPMEAGVAYYGDRRADTFTKVIPLPYQVETSPTSVKYRNGTLTITLQKRRSEQTDGWVPLHPS